ncbi:methionyl-tRNA formyltransferase [Penaeicola halotolerans]|uniref:methionyl-tRNA formyltransferase n=1 Tax=Penaeicola halotolerans TaxID=2793196 RepID=UPI001CF8CB98|nr:formyltransferase family protein [Penaeicola halotolerans]
MVVLYLMTFKGLTSLNQIVQKGYSKYIEYVCIGIDKNVVNDYSNEILELCKSSGIKFFFRENVPDHQSEYIIAVSWRWLIKSDSQVIVFHDSLLPKYRGFAPLVNCLKNGETEIGVSALLASEKFDEGPIINQISICIDYPIKINLAIEKISFLYAELIIDIVDKIIGKKLNFYSQDHDKATYSLWLDDLDYKINWNLDSNSIKRFVDAVGYPYNGAKSSIDGQTIKIEEVEVLKDLVIENRVPGKVLMMENDCPVVVCGSGLIKIVSAYDKDGMNILPLKRFRTRFI